MTISRLQQSFDTFSILHSREAEDGLELAKELISQTQALQCGQIAVLALLVYDIS